jgi:4-amino-4-deoxy-L-arabinose transferase-like glycosyltransferase
MRHVVPSGRCVAYALVGLGVVLRILAIAWVPVASDAAEYAVLARSILLGNGMWLPWGEQWELDAWIGAPSHHYPPLYPAYLVPFLAVFEFGPLAPQVASLTAGLVLLGTYHRLTARFFGPERAIWFTALLALDPVLLVTTGTGYAENLVTLLFVATIAAILMSLRRPRWILVAGATAGLAYLTKSSVGPSFLVAGLAGFAWRFHFVRWRVFRDRAYLAAIGLFGGIVGAWALRNVGVFWDGTPEGLLTAWQTSEWFARAFDEALAQPSDLLCILGARLPFYAGLLVLVAGPWWREIRRLPFLRDESASALGLAVGLTYVLAWLISGIFWVIERSPVFWADMSRYVVFANPVVWWMAAKAANPGTRSFRRRFAVAAVTLVVLDAAVFLTPQGGVFEAYQDLRERTQEGDVVALDRVPKYEAAIHLVGTGVLLEPYATGTHADYVLTTNMTRSYEGYRVLEVYGGRNDTAVMPTFGAALWGRTA